MKTLLIPRSDHETYFLPADPGRPSRKDVERFLMANHPLYSASCELDGRICTITGSRYLMLTVLDVPAGKIRVKKGGARLVTATAILASSRWAERECAIRCGDELVSFGKVPSSVLLSASRSGDPPADAVFETGGQLVDFARREGIRVSLFASRGKIPVFISVVLFCAVLSAFSPAPRPVVPPVPEALVRGYVPSIATVHFAKTFAAEIDAIHAGGAVVEDYRFDRRGKPVTTIALRNGDGNIVLRELRRIESIESVTLGELRYSEKTGRYPVYFSVKIPGNGKPAGSVVPPAFALIGDLESWCASRGWKLSASAAEGTSAYTVKIPASGFPRFPESLFVWCSDRNLAVTSLHISRKEGSAVFLVTMDFSPDSARREIPPFDPEKVGAVFGIGAGERTVETPKTPPDLTTLVGRIMDSSEGVFVFGKTSSGKISVEKEKSE